MMFSKLTLTYALAVLLSAVFMRQVVLSIIHVIGEWGLEIALWGVYAVAAAAVVVCFLRKRLNASRYLYPAFLIILAVVAAQHIPVPVERIHIIKYGIMGWLAMNDQAPKHSRLFSAAALSFVFCLSCSSLDEILQLFIPGRVSQLSDVILGCVGAIFGIMIRTLAR